MRFWQHGIFSSPMYKSDIKLNCFSMMMPPDGNLQAFTNTFPDINPEEIAVIDRLLANRNLCFPPLPGFPGRGRRGSWLSVSKAIRSMEGVFHPPPAPPCQAR